MSDYPNDPRAGSPLPLPPNQPSAPSQMPYPTPPPAAPVQTWPGAPGEAPQHAATPTKGPSKKSLAILGVLFVIILVLGFGYLLLQGWLTTRDLEARSEEFVASFNRGEDVAPMLDGTGECASKATFPTLVAAGPMTFEPTGAEYYLQSDGETSTTSTKTIDNDEFVAAFTKGRPQGTDVGLVFGTFSFGGEPDETVFYLIREPEEEWLICGIGTSE